MERSFYTLTDLGWVCAACVYHLLNPELVVVTTTIAPLSPSWLPSFPIFPILLQMSSQPAFSWANLQLSDVLPTRSLPLVKRVPVVSISAILMSLKFSEHQPASGSCVPSHAISPGGVTTSRGLSCSTLASGFCVPVASSTGSCGSTLYFSPWVASTSTVGSCVTTMSLASSCVSMLSTSCSTVGSCVAAMLLVGSYVLASRSISVGCSVSCVGSCVPAMPLTSSSLIAS